MTDLTAPAPQFKLGDRLTLSDIGRKAVGTGSTSMFGQTRADDIVFEVTEVCSGEYKDGFITNDGYLQYTYYRGDIITGWSTVPFGGRNVKTEDGIWEVYVEKAE